MKRRGILLEKNRFTFPRGRKPSDEIWVKMPSCSAWWRPQFTKWLVDLDLVQCNRGLGVPICLFSILLATYILNVILGN